MIWESIPQQNSTWDPLGSESSHGRRTWSSVLQTCQLHCFGALWVGDDEGVRVCFGVRGLRV